MLHLIMMGCKTKEKQSWVVEAKEIRPGLLREKLPVRQQVKGLGCQLKKGDLPLQVRH
jgi:hypothetical protein